MFTINIHSPTEGVVGVKIKHFARDDPSPSIPLFPDSPPIPNVQVGRDGDTLSISSAGLTAVVSQNPYSISFKSPTRELTSAGQKYVALYDVPSKWTLGTAANSSCLMTDIGSNPNPVAKSETIRYLNSELNISPGELIYGFGEQFGAFVKNGEQLRSPLSQQYLWVCRPVCQALESRSVCSSESTPQSV